MLSKRIFEPLIPTLVVLFASVFSFGSVAYAETPRPLSVNNQIIEQRIQENQTKSTKLDTTSEVVDQLETKKEHLNSQLKAEKQRIAELKQRIAQKAEAKRIAEARQTRVVQQVQPTTQTVSLPTGGGARSGCGDNSYAAYIYGMESGGRVPGNCNTTARNAGGCYGIGQACPGSKVAHCGADYACQNAWFTNYAMQRYGSWASAYNFHRANGWW